MVARGNKKIAVLDFGGQYAHLIASKIRRLGAYSEIRYPGDFSPGQFAEEFAGLVLSGGPASVYEPDAPRSDPGLLNVGLPVLGICYGHQLMMLQAGGSVRGAAGREYGPARVHIERFDGLFTDEEGHSDPTVWMSHGDEVVALPDGFVVAGSTPDCAFAAAFHPAKKLIGIQFHPEVTGTDRGDVYLKNFIRLCGLADSWRLDDFVEKEIRAIQAQVGPKKVFLLISGGVDSTVAFALLAKALPPDHLRALIVDTGFMRKDEVREVRAALSALGMELGLEEAGERYFLGLAGVSDPEEKRRIIGELFVDVQEGAVAGLGLNPAEWFLGQGTIYPDTIESGATKHSHRIKTHHNRVARIEELLAKGQVVEPLRDLYKDEVRRLGRLLGLPAQVVERHPFPGPGLAVRCLCAGEMDAGARERFAEQVAAENRAIAGMADVSAELARAGLGLRVLPLRSVGVKGDQRSYAHPALVYEVADPGRPVATDFAFLEEIARRVTGRQAGVNRILFMVASKDAGGLPRLERKAPAYLTPDRIECLRNADHLVHAFQVERGLYDQIWQFPVVLAPLGLPGGGETIILRPINSVDAMTARAFPMSPADRAELGRHLLELGGIDLVLFDVTSKPPGTIEWE